MTVVSDTRRHARGSQTGAVVGLLVGLVVAVTLSLAYGSRSVSLHEISDGLGMWVRGQTAQDIGAIAVQQRIPRTVLALIAGAALGLSGALMQAVTRNPVADPGILGVNTGAALFVVCGIAFFGINSTYEYLALALIGGSIVAVFVYVVGSIGPGGSTPIKLALAGAATTAALSSLVSAVLLPRVAAMNEFRFWQVGGVAGANWSSIAIVSPLLGVAAIVAFACGPSLNALGIAFVGLMVPHLIRLLFGPDQRWLLPLSAMGGAILLTVSDTIGRLIGYPGEVEAGIVTAFVGAPVLIIVARRTKMKSL